jgi:hypothetical protein
MQISLELINKLSRKLLNLSQSLDNLKITIPKMPTKKFELIHVLIQFIDI